MTSLTRREAKQDAARYIVENSNGRSEVPAEGAGIPLFRMRLDDGGYAALVLMLRRCLESPFVRHMCPGSVAGLFCLFVAETLRRRVRGGAWSWEQAVQPLGLCPQLDQEERHALVQRGLAFWGLQVRRSADGSRMSLQSLLLQAGLPTPRRAQSVDWAGLAAEFAALPVPTFDFRSQTAPAPAFIPAPTAFAELFAAA